MLKLANVHKDDVVYDLGCGDGKIVIAAAKKYGARGVGIDIDPERIREANANAKAAGVSDRVTFILGDIFDEAVHDSRRDRRHALPPAARSTSSCARGSCASSRPARRVVSNSFDMGDEWPPQTTRDM